MNKSKGCSSIPPSPKPYPWLMFSHGKSSKIQTFYSIPDDRCYMRRLPYFAEKIICGSCEGWMVMLDENMNSDDCFLLNLVSMEKIQLPPFRDSDYHFCQLSSPPTEPNCILAFFRRTEPFRAVFWRPGQENWIEQLLDDALTHVMTRERKIYGLIDYSDLVVVDVAFDHGLQVRKLGAEPAPLSLLPDITVFAMYLIESRGDIFLVHLVKRGESTRRIRDIDVFKFNMKTLDWAKVDDIGDNAFFISGRTNCMSRSASESGLKGNSIYFMEHGDTCLYVFDIKEKSIHASLPCPNVVHNLSQVYWVDISSCHSDL